MDMIYSQAVLEHVDDLRGTYHAMRGWLNRGGFISHQIDFRCHGLTTPWNGHWAISDRAWRLVRGRRAYLLNREPHSTHIRLIKEAGFVVVCDRKVELPSALSPVQFAAPFRNMPAEDRVISAAFIQAVAGPPPSG
jgi:hypothetical protein